MLEINIIPLDVEPTTRLYLTQGNTATLYITINNVSTDGSQVEPYNLTGCTVWFTLKRYTNDVDAQAIYQVNSVTSNIIIDPEMGLVCVIIPSATTAALPSWYQDYYYDIQVKDTAGNYITGSNGTIGIYPSVTQSK